MLYQTLYRSSSLMMIAAALLLILGGILVAVLPDGGLSSPTAPLAYYLGLIVSVFASASLFWVQVNKMSKLGFAGLLMAIVGAVIYSGPAFVLVAGTLGVSTWHDVWGFAMGNILLIGPALFFLGLIFLGTATRKAGVFDRWIGISLTTGGAVWLVAYFTGLPFMLTLGSLATGIGLLAAGIALVSGRAAAQFKPQPAL
jgi:hypothetical protein